MSNLLDSDEFVNLTSRECEPLKIGLFSRLSPNTWRVTGTQQTFEEGKNLGRWGHEARKRRKRGKRGTLNGHYHCCYGMAQILGGPENIVTLAPDMGTTSLPSFLSKAPGRLYMIQGIPGQL